ncbi:RtcB family protein [Haliangium sp.]|uniref:RtcB family protein n=1 Tax=Haliangium sp. TaxID=2663208 RepID=UPI003D136978
MHTLPSRLPGPDPVTADSDLVADSGLVADSDLVAEVSPRPRVIAGPDVWLETEAVDQLGRIAALPGCVRAVGMPDLHPGPGVPIGAAFAFDAVIRPALVGSDAGCGARLWAVGRSKLGADALERRVRAALAEPPLAGVDPVALFEAVWRRGAPGLADVAGVPANLAALAAAEPAAGSDLGAASDPGDDPGEPPTFLDRAALGRALGTTGGGNHFAEITRVDRIVDRVAAAELGLDARTTCVLVHSGSRGLGRALAGHWGEVALAEHDPAAGRYLSQLAGALRFARANRLVIGWRLLSALGAASPGRVSASIDLTHNTAVCEPIDDRGGRAWVYRKGCAPAHLGQLTLILGSRGTRTWIARGAGRHDGLCSVAHGAGRRMTRAEAQAKVRHRYRRRDLTRTAAGGRVLCARTDSLYEEHPDAYKDIESVMASVEDAGLAARVAALLPVLTIKQ